MKRAKLIFIPIMLILLASCASQNIMAIDQTGRQVPMPHYVLQSMDGNFQVLYYWSKHTGGRDLDGTPLSYPAYFDFTKDHKVDPKKVSKVVLTIEVLNRDRKPYELWERSVMHDRVGRVITRGGRLAYSDQRMRVYQFELPIDEKLKTVDYAIDLADSSGMPIMHFGSYEYVVGNSSWKGGDTKQRSVY